MANRGDHQMPGPPVVIVGLASVVGLQTARLFAARGVRVIGIAGSLRHFAARTRVCDRIIEADVHTMAPPPWPSHRRSTPVPGHEALRVQVGVKRRARAVHTGDHDGAQEPQDCAERTQDDHQCRSTGDAGSLERDLDHLGLERAGHSRCSHAFCCRPGLATQRARHQGGGWQCCQVIPRTREVLTRVLDRSVQHWGTRVG